MGFDSFLKNLVDIGVEHGYVTLEAGKPLKVSTTAYFTISYTIGICWYLIFFILPYVFNAFSETFRKLPVKEKLFWNLAVIRGIYGFIGTIGSFNCRYFDPELVAVDLTTGRTAASYFWNICHLGYFVFEWSSLVYFDIRFRTFSKGLHGHHLIAIISFNSVAYYDVYHFTGITCFILEGSTLFSCICYCLLKAKMEKTLFWKINQLILIHTFHLRSVLESLMMYELYNNWDEFSSKPFTCFACHVSGLVLVFFFLTPYWTFRKTEQFFKPKDWNNDDDSIENKTKKK